MAEINKITNRHTRLEILGALAAAFLSAGAIFWWMINLYDEREPQAVVAAAVDLSAPRVLKLSDLTTFNISRRLLPKTAVVKAEEVVGQVLTHPLAANQIITTADLVYHRDPDSEANLVPPGLVGFTLSANWLSAGFPKIKKNDFITIEAAWPASALPRYTPAGAGPIARGVPILAVSADKEGVPGSVLVALTPDLAGRLLQFHAANYPLVVVAEPAQSLDRTNQSDAAPVTSTAR